MADPSPATVDAVPSAPKHPLVGLNQLALSVSLGSFRADLLYWGVLGTKWWRNYAHTHSFFEICYAQEGRGAFEINGVRHEVSAGDLFIARPGEPHEIVSSRKAPLGIAFWAYTLVGTTGTPPNRSPASRSIDALLDAVAASHSTVVRAGEAIGATLHLLSDEVSHKAPGYSRAVEGLTVKLLLDGARAFAGEGVAGEQVEPPARSTAEAVTRTAVAYLRDNLARPLQLRDVAAQVQLSERHLTRLFLEATGQTVLDYLTGLRLETAAQLLLDPNLPIKQVARTVGYPDVHYFTTLFGRRMGMTPARFRANGGTRFLEAPRNTGQTLPRRPSK
jgi:AraC family L-rhamnose operon transcriptional activator RhaR